VEKTRAKDAREAKQYEAREVMQKQIKEADLLAKRLKEPKEERKRVKVEAKGAKKRAKEIEKVRAEEKKVADALEVLKAPTSKGVGWERRRSKWRVQLTAHGRQWHLGHFGVDDHTKAVAFYERNKDKTETELEALFTRQQTTDNSHVEQ
jgi:hypothetical protein